MKANKAAPTGDWKEKSTVFADVAPMVLEGASVRVYDCAGQVTVVLTRLSGFQAHMVFEYVLYSTFVHDAHFDRSPTRGCCRCS